jgi:hypothetical protein
MGIVACCGSVRSGRLKLGQAVLGKDIKEKRNVKYIKF